MTLFYKIGIWPKEAILLKKKKKRKNKIRDIIFQLFNNVVNSMTL